MKITLVGVVVIIGSIVVLVLTVDAIATHLNGNQGNGNGQPNNPQQ